jgi:Cyclic nucleotide-binding domain
VKITVVSSAGKEAVLAMLGPHDFFGEGALVGQSLRMSTATTLEGTTVFQVACGQCLALFTINEPVGKVPWLLRWRAISMVEKTISSPARMLAEKEPLESTA